MLQNGHANYFIVLTENPAGPLHVGARAVAKSFHPPSHGALNRRRDTA